MPEMISVSEDKQTEMIVLNARMEDTVYNELGVEAEDVAVAISKLQKDQDP